MNQYGRTKAHNIFHKMNKSHDTNEVCFNGLKLIHLHMYVF